MNIHWMLNHQFILTNEEHLWNIALLILNIDDGISISCNELHSAKHPLPIDCVVDGIENFTKYQIFGDL